MKRFVSALLLSAFAMAQQNDVQANPEVDLTTRELTSSAQESFLGHDDTRELKKKRSSNKKKKSGPSLKPSQCPFFQATSAALKCANNDCRGGVIHDDKNVLTNRYKYSMDVRGFKWNKNSKTFEGHLWLGMPNQNHPSKGTIKLKTHDASCTGSECQNFYLNRNEWIRELIVTYERYQKPVIVNGIQSQTQYDIVKYLTVKTSSGREKTMPDRPRNALVNNNNNNASSNTVNTTNTSTNTNSTSTTSNTTSTATNSNTTSTSTNT